MSSEEAQFTSSSSRKSAPDSRRVKWTFETTQLLPAKAGRVYGTISKSLPRRMTWALPNLAVVDTTSIEKSDSETRKDALKCVLAYTLCMTLAGPLSGYFRTSLPTYLLVLVPLVIPPILTIGATFHVNRLILELFALVTILLITDSGMRIYSFQVGTAKLGTVYSILLSSVFTASAAYIRWGTKRGKVASTMLMATIICITKIFDLPRSMQLVDQYLEDFLYAPILGCVVSLAVCLLIFPRTATNRARSLLASDLRNQLADLQVAIASSVSSDRSPKWNHFPDLDVTELRELRRDVALEHPIHVFSWAHRGSYATDLEEPSLDEDFKVNRARSSRGAPDEGRSDPVLSGLEKLHHSIGCLKSLAALEPPDQDLEMSRILSSVYEKLTLINEVIKGVIPVLELENNDELNFTPQFEKDSLYILLLAQIKDISIQISRAVMGREVDLDLMAGKKNIPDDPFEKQSMDHLPKSSLSWHSKVIKYILQHLDRRVIFAFKTWLISCVICTCGFIPTISSPFNDMGLYWSLIIMLMISNPHGTITLSSSAIFRRYVRYFFAALIGATIGFIFRMDSVSPNAYPILSLAVSVPSFISIGKSRFPSFATLTLLAFTVVLLKPNDNEISIYGVFYGNILASLIGLISARLIEIRWSVWTWSRSADYEAQRGLGQLLCHLSVYLNSVREALMDNTTLPSHSRQGTEGSLMNEALRLEITQLIESSSIPIEDDNDDEESIVSEIAKPSTPAGLIPPPYPRVPYNLPRQVQRARLQAMENMIRSELRYIVLLVKDAELAKGGNDRKVTSAMAVHIESMINITAGMWSLRRWIERQRRRLGCSLLSLDELNSNELHQVDNSVHVMNQSILRVATKNLCEMQRDSEYIVDGERRQNAKYARLIRVMDNGMNMHLKQFMKEAEARGVLYCK